MKIERLGIIGGPSYHYNSDLLKEVYAASRNRAAATEETQFIFWEVGLDRFFTTEVDKYWANIGGWIASSSYTLSQDNGCDYIAVAGNFLPKINLEEELRLQQELSGGNPGFTRPVFIDMNDCIAEEAEKIGAKKILLLGPAYMMGDEFIKSYADCYNIELPNLDKFRNNIGVINQIITKELSRDIMNARSNELVIDFVKKFVENDHPDAIALGCPELSSIITEDDFSEDIQLIDGPQALIDKISSLVSS